MMVVLFGATGMVGTEALHHCLDEEDIHRVVSIGRRSTGVVHEKLQEIEHTDFENYAPLESVLREADLCLYCIGVYQGAVPEDAFWKITCDYLEALLQTLIRVNPDITFCLFSAKGADRKEKARMLFARAKGRAENLLFDSGLKRCYAFRPGYINPGRRESASKIPAWLVRPFYRLMPFLGIDAVDLAGVMLRVGMDGGSRTIFENSDLRRLSRSYLAREV